MREREREFLHFERERERVGVSVLSTLFKFGGENECALHSV